MALIKVDYSNGDCRCAKCGAQVMWANHPASPMSGNWAGIVPVSFVRDYRVEAYGRGNTGKRKVATKVAKDAVIHVCGHPEVTKHAEKYGQALEKVKQSVWRIPATPTEPPKPEPSKPEPPAKPKHQCPHCQFTSYTQGLMDRHIQRKHGDSGSKTPEKGDDVTTGPIEQFIEEQIKTRIGDAVDEAKVKAIVADALKDVQPETHERIIIQTTDRKRIEVGEFVHKAFDDCYWILSEGLYVYAFGLKGSGKSTLAQQLAKALNREFFEQTFGPADTPTTIRGFRDATGTVWSTEAMKAMKTGGFLHIDEGDNGNPGAWVTVNNALSNGLMSGPDGTFEIHKDFLLMVSGNTKLRGGEAGHATRRALDSATSDRFQYVEVTYDTKLEAKVAKAEAGGNVEISAPWVAWVVAARKWGQANTQGTWVLSPRSSYAGARLLSRVPKRFANKAVEKVADMVAFKGMDKDMKKRVLDACPLPTIEVAG